MWEWGLGFKALGFKVFSLVIGVWIGFRVQGLGFKV